MAATKKVIITLIAATTPMDREVAVEPVKSMYYGITNLDQLVIHTCMIASGSVLQTPALVQVMVLDPVSESLLSHW